MRNIAILAILLLLALNISAQPGTVKVQRKVSNLSADFNGKLIQGDQFGTSVADIGDLDGNGYNDLAVGAPQNSPTVWILFLKEGGLIEKSVQIKRNLNGFPDINLNRTRFGWSVAPIGDIDEDGVPDLAVSAPSWSVSTTGQGAVFILFMNADGTVKGNTLITSSSPGFTSLASGDYFGEGQICSLGDLDRDGIGDIAIGTDFRAGYGALFILFLNQQGGIKNYVELNNNTSVLSGKISAFGKGVANIGDLDGDGVIELAVGDMRSRVNADQKGAIFILSINQSGQIKKSKVIDDSTPGFSKAIDSLDYFGKSVTNLGDIDGDGAIDIAVGAFNHYIHDTVDGAGAVYIIMLNKDATIKDYQLLTDGSGNFQGVLSNDDFFGTSVSKIGDINGDNVPELAVGAHGADDGFTNAGAVYLLYLNGVPQTGIKENTVGVKPLSIYPNPAASVINITIPGVSAGQRSFVQVTDAFGKLVYSATVGGNRAQLSLDDMAPGVYVVNVTGGSHCYAARIMVLPK